MLKLVAMGGRRIDLNSADLSVILQETVLDTRKAEVLIDARPFWDYSELRMLPGFGKKTLLKLADVATVVPPQPIDINLCSAADLQSIPGVGTVLARRIVTNRPYDSLEDVALVKGVSTNVMHVLRQRSVVIIAANNNLTESDWSNTSALDINNCDKELLLQLRGVGPRIAERIVSGRPFDYIDDLRDVKGVGASLFEKLDDLCVVSSRVVPDMQAEFVEEDTWFAEGDFEAQIIECLDLLDIGEAGQLLAAALGMHAVIRREFRVMRGEGSAVRPHYARRDFPGDRGQILAHTAIGQGRDFIDQAGHYIAVFVVMRQRLDNHRRRFDVLGAARQERVQDRGRLPINYVDVA